MKTVIIFQLDLIRRANYSAFHSHLKTLFGEQAERFIQEALPTVNRYKQAHITQACLFKTLRDHAASLSVTLDESGVKEMWSTLHPDAHLLTQDIRSAIAYARAGHEVIILSYNSPFATDDF